MRAIRESEESAALIDGQDWSVDSRVLDVFKDELDSNPEQSEIMDKELWNKYYEARQEIERLTSEKEKIYQELLAHSVALSAMYNSSSWRITAPIRKISDVFKNLF